MNLDVGHGRPLPYAASAHAGPSRGEAREDGRGQVCNKAKPQKRRHRLRFVTPLALVAPSIGNAVRVEIALPDNQKKIIAC